MYFRQSRNTRVKLLLANIHILFFFPLGRCFIRNIPNYMRMTPSQLPVKWKNVSLRKCRCNFGILLCALFINQMKQNSQPNTV